MWENKSSVSADETKNNTKIFFHIYWEVKTFDNLNSGTKDRTFLEKNASKYVMYAYCGTRDDLG